MTRILEVAAGVVIREDGQVLMAQRPPGKAYEGWWEFPGGKIEAGETPAQALARELEEELGLHIEASHPWLVREHVYPHAHVRLHFRRVFGAWGDVRGEPHANEGQAFGWHPIVGAPAQPLLPASVAVFGWLKLPAVLTSWQPAPGSGHTHADDTNPSHTHESPAAVLPAQRHVEARLLAQARLPGLLAASVPVCLARLPDDPARARAQAPEAVRLSPWLQEARSLATELRAQGGFLLVPSGVDEELARLSDALLLDAAALAGAAKRPAVMLCAARCETPQDLARAEALGLDFALLAPGMQAVLPNGQPPGLPCYACPPGPDLRAAMSSGAHGVLLEPSSSSSIEPGIT